ncbi:hypothetical protein SU69_06840 [Thermosipho melanesiensis]|uniref:Uncharacterized protein n=1 Tax=Thermosipho melanesiensis TaxID=46541 RepID=A0ABM6GH06_9BACT|nr:hypothetical protein BW47_07165 [Thermosipho melanesiensis]OOC36225.1 hypothetical protein SU68_06910 [Thermosipho melanesiensis]OOC37043.1 hypothetical protein SU69_06840 [Thermosipho melanesiensis]OOC37795.1 hypothetical protein SU70_06850 [Thermosipho melanesiensis]OOC41022.1 hypothetical protein SU71_06830 [Thermosipho melanesiensis]
MEPSGNIPTTFPLFKFLKIFLIVLMSGSPFCFGIKFSDLNKEPINGLLKLPFATTQVIGLSKKELIKNGSKVLVWFEIKRRGVLGIFLLSQD